MCNHPTISIYCTEVCLSSCPQSVCVCWVSSYFRNPPNSDYRIFSVHMWLFLCVRIHTGVGHTNSESAQHFWLGKARNFFLCSWRDSNLSPMDLKSNSLPIEPWTRIFWVDHLMLKTGHLSHSIGEGIGNGHISSGSIIWCGKWNIFADLFISG